MNGNSKGIHFWFHEDQTNHSQNKNNQNMFTLTLYNSEPSNGALQFEWCSVQFLDTFRIWHLRTNVFLNIFVFVLFNKYLNGLNIYI